MSALPELHGKIAVVTGGASGIGRGIAVQLLAEGMEVAIADVDEAALEATAAELGAVPFRTDVSDPADVEALAANVLARFGAVHVVCNNAGIGPRGPVPQLTHDDWRWILGVNLWGVINGVTTFLPILERNEDGGHIVNTASMMGIYAVPDFASYALTKFGVVGMSESLAQELEAAGSKVGVSVLCPGPVRTNIKHSSRTRPDDLAPGGLEDFDLEAFDTGWPDGMWMEPEEAGAIVVDAIKNGHFYAVTHGEMLPFVEERHAKIVEACHRAVAFRRRWAESVRARA